MALLKLVFAPDKRLTQRAEPVACVDDAVRKIFDDMNETLYKHDGLGLAAVQVGLMKRLIVVDIDYDKRDEPRTGLCLANPEIIRVSEELQTIEEGCLSLPGVYVEVDRPREIEVSYLDYDGKPQTRTVQGLMATCIQHEIDHLNGITLLDRLSSPLKRQMALKKIQKFIKRA